MKVKCANGWTKEKMIEHVLCNYLGFSAGHYSPNSDATSWSCTYRGSEGRKCAIGMFIPDALYKVNFEGKDVVALIKSHPHLLTYMPFTDLPGLFSFQRAHDTAHIINDPLEQDEIVFNNIIYWIEEYVED